MSALDLSALRMEQGPPAIPPRPWGLRLLGLLAAALALVVAATFVWPLVQPVRAVPTAAIMTAAAAGAGPAAVTLAEAAGWIEPDPFFILVRPLVAGRVESLPLLEGSTVAAGVTVVATLASASLQAQHERATAMAAEREAELQTATARRLLAEAQLLQKAGPRAAAAEADMVVRERQARLANGRGAHERARADLRGAAAAMKAQQLLAAAGSSFTVALRRAEAAVAAAEAVASAAERELAAMDEELRTAISGLQLAQEIVSKPVDLDGAVAVGKAEEEKARAARDAALVEVQISAREIGWLQVLAPASGVVMKVNATPGTTVGPEGEPLLTLYDPQQLRARIDVPLGSIAAIREGQQVELRSEVLGDVTVHGVVQRIQRESDLLKNTLQVKVAVLDPPSLLRPETLCRARFLGDETTAAAGTNVTFKVPKAAVQNGHVFVFDPARGVAHGIAVQALHEDGDTALVRGELSVTQRAIVAPVTEGERVREENR